GRRGWRSSGQGVAEAQVRETNGSQRQGQGNEDAVAGGNSEDLPPGLDRPDRRFQRLDGDTGDGGRPSFVGPDDPVMVPVNSLRAGSLESLGTVGKGEGHGQKEWCKAADAARPLRMRSFTGSVIQTSS